MEIGVRLGANPRGWIVVVFFCEPLMVVRGVYAVVSRLGKLDMVNAVVMVAMVATGGSISGGEIGESADVEAGKFEVSGEKRWGRQCSGGGVGNEQEMDSVLRN